MFNFISRWLTNSPNPLENPAISLDSPEIWNTFAQSNSAGVPVSYNAVMGYPPVRRAVSLIAGYVAKLPLNVHKRRDDERAIDIRHPAYRLLNKSPSQLYTPFVFRRQMQAYALLYGSGYAAILRDEFAQPIELLLLDASNTWQVVQRNWVNGNPVTSVIYQTYFGNHLWTLQAEDVLHIKDYGDGIVGDALISIAKNALGLGLATERFAGSYFKHGTSSKIYVEVPAVAKDRTKQEQFRTEWMQHHAGVQNAHRPAFVPLGTKVTAVGDSNTNAELVEMREQDLLMVADLLNVPPHKLGSKIATAYGSLESENQAFLTDCLDPHLIQWEQEIETKLLTESEKQLDTRYAVFDRKAVLAIDRKTESDILLNELNNGGISFEEYRAKNNMSITKDEKQEWRHAANIVIDGEEPEPPTIIQQAAPLPTEPPKEDTPEEEQEEEDNEKNPEEERSIRITKKDLSRLITRMEKAVMNGKTDLTEHKAIILDHLSEWKNADAFVNRWLGSLQCEINSVVKEQYPQVFERQDLNTLVEELCKT